MQRQYSPVRVAPENRCYGHDREKPSKEFVGKSCVAVLLGASGRFGALRSCLDGAIWGKTDVKVLPARGYMQTGQQVLERKTARVGEHWRLLAKHGESGKESRILGEKSDGRVPARRASVMRDKSKDLTEANEGNEGRNDR
jgi:hypothetical protein